MAAIQPSAEQRRNGREYLWFAVLLLVMLATAAGATPLPPDAALHEFTVPL